MKPPPGDKRCSAAPDDVTRQHGAMGNLPAAPSGQGSTPPELDRHSRYRVLRLLGKGGMGAVYLAEHLVMGRQVALKTIAAGFLTSEEAVGRFRREVRAAARLNHPNIVQAYDADQAGSLHFLVMEYVQGLSVAEYARRKGPLPVEQACSIVAQAAVGLQHAHEQGLIHRDVKPQNLMLTSKGQVKVLDFGLVQFVRPEDVLNDSARTATGAVLGTADYIAPEQTSSSRTVDIRADVYSLGCTLYYLLAGRVPFPEGTVIDKFIHHATTAPPPLPALRAGLPPELVAVVEKMMAKRPEDRYQTPGEAARALRPFIGGGVPSAAVPPHAPAPAPSSDVTRTYATGGASTKIDQPERQAPKRKHLLIAALSGFVVLGLLVVFLAGLLGRKGGGDTTAEKAPDPSRAVSWSAKGATHAYTDDARMLSGVLDFQELVGAGPSEFRDWQANLGKNFRASFIANRIGVGPPLFNAVAVRQRTPVAARVFPDLTEKETDNPEKIVLKEKLGLNIIGLCDYTSPETGKVLETQLWVAGAPTGYHWIYNLSDLSAKVEEMRKEQEKRPIAIAKGGGDLFQALGALENGVKWKALWTLTRDEVLSTVEQYRDQNWRPDVLAPYWDGERFRFVLVVRDNSEAVE
jgi:hypothetical protein